jgi:hypothetical protein
MENIILFNPNDKPFGMLSNNTYTPMTINKKKYDTATNYILSNMLTSLVDRTIVQNTKIKPEKGLNTNLLKMIDYLLDEKLQKDWIKSIRMAKSRLKS